MEGGRGDDGDGDGEERKGMVSLVIDDEIITNSKDFEEAALSPGAQIFNQPNMNLHIVAVIGCGKKIDVDIIKFGIEATLIHHPRFSSLQVT